MAEAYHYQAWVNAGSPTGDINKTLPTVCDASGDDSKSTASRSASPSPSTSSTSSDSSASYYCVQAETIYSNQVLPWIMEEIAIGGAPYSTDDYVIANGWASGNGQDWLMPTSIEAYSDAAGGDCASPLTSKNLCGPLVIEQIGGTIPSVKFGNYGADGYGKWVAAGSSRFNTLLSGYHDINSSDSTTTAAGWLCTGEKGSTQTTDCSVESKYGIKGAGLENANKIFVFGDQTQADFGAKGAGPLSVWCFMDGSITRNYASQPFCSSGKGAEDYKNLMETHNKSSKPSQCNKPDNVVLWKDAAEWTRNGQNGPVSATHFYSGTVCQQGSTYALYWGEGDAPEYAASKSGESYRWPMMLWTELKCSDARVSGLDGKGASESVNPGGVPTMCGNDYSDWLANILPVVD